MAATRTRRKPAEDTPNELEALLNEVQDEADDLIDLDLSEAVEFSPVPRGQYFVRVTEAIAKLNSKGGRQIQLTLVGVGDDDFARRKISKYLQLAGKGAGMTKAALKALDAWDVETGRPSVAVRHLVGREVFVNLDIDERADQLDDEGKPKWNVIKSFTAV